jgi:hypothetical protein
MGMSSEESEYVRAFVWVGLGFMLADGSDGIDCSGGEGGCC